MPFFLKKNIKHFLLYILLFSISAVNAQESNSTIDSLLKVISTLSSPSPEVKLVKGADTTLINTLNQVSNEFRYIDSYEKALKYAQDALLQSEKIDYQKGIASAHSNKGIAYGLQSNYEKALDEHLAAIKMSRKIGFIKGIISSYNGIGNAFLHKGDYKQALENYLAGLKISEENKIKNAIATFSANIGIIYYERKNYEEALAAFSKSLKAREEMGNKTGMANSNSGIGAIYFEQKNYKLALKHFSKSLELQKEINDKQGVADSYSNIGNVYEKEKSYKKALLHYQQALKIKEEIGEKIGIANTSADIGNIYMQLDEPEKAHHHLSRSLEVSKSIGAKNQIKVAYLSLSELYKKKGDYKQAFKYHKLYDEIKDTILNEVSDRQISEMSIKYESEKKEKDIQLLTKDKKLQQSEIGRQKLIRNGFIVGLVLALLLAYALLNRFRISRKQKQVIEAQNMQIVESITYSKRIQDALLPSIEEMQNALPGIFVFYQPKNIVSGDFYFFKEFKNYILLTCVDCTGHGVPGGFMSTLGSLLLDKIANNELLPPSEILTKLNDEIIRILQQRSGGELQDGMDLSVCLIDRINCKVEFCGARNGIIVVTDKEAKRYKASPLPVGGNYMKKGVPIERNFHTQSITLNTSDWVYMYTDGFIEQLGSSEGTTMNYEQFERQLIRLSHTQTAAGKVDLLKEELANWRGENDITDDILIMGFHI